VFGHVGDRIGRKPALVTCRVLMGLSTFTIGLLPTTATIGVGRTDHPGLAALSDQREQDAKVLPGDPEDRQ